ncbi:MAG: bifunctional diaminohydroxyphosphoribosylaminopyrimidine deaminase/5-amino-6-(5-phosphoribosylamino)uracil reductase RibD [Candidatus Edwardsbacteria bacterium]|nr:bifunctional diaminohydroxyphosphoribosylaminopyrimidine deaminase/5-amino-6-(5-phosphoribosylamino)uracil reductase RibD [Candidatus Edwardsbacteria bacterium]
MPAQAADHRQYMAMALELARQGLGRTWPNPMVGAVVVRDGEIVGSGYHHGPGLPHAEAEALARAGERARGATLYVNLEPCSHTGKRTPPCTGAIIAAGIVRVVSAMDDPNPKVDGDGHRALARAGIAVITNVMEKEANQLNEVYGKYMATGLPFCTLKLAMSLDGRIALAGGASRGLSGDESLKLVHALRLEHEAIMVGAGTLIADDPELTVRLVDNPDKKQPTRFILDGRLSVPPTAKVFDQSVAKTVVVTTAAADPARKTELERREIEVWTAKGDERARIDLADLLRTMGLHEYVNVLVEGGSRVAASFLAAGLVDKAAFLYSPRLIGGDGVPAVAALGIGDLGKTLGLRDLQARRVGDDLLVEGYLPRQGGD